MKGKDAAASPPGERALFPRAERMRTDREYREVVRRGERVATAHFTIYRDAHGDRERKVGISAGRKIGGAVARNRIKRLVREFCRHHKDLFPRGTRTAIVVKVFPERDATAVVGAEIGQAIARRWGVRDQDGPR